MAAAASTPSATRILAVVSQFLTAILFSWRTIETENSLFGAITSDTGAIAIALAKLRDPFSFFFIAPCREICLFLPGLSLATIAPF